MSDYDCLLYIEYGKHRSDKYKSIRELKYEIDSITGSNLSNYWEAATNSVNIEISFNETYDKEETELGNFVRYPFYVEVDAQEGANLTSAFNDVCALIQQLRARGASVIPDCDFEEEIEAKIGKDRVNWRLSKF